MIDAVSLRGTTELSMPGKERGRRRGRSVVLGVLVVVFVVLLGGVDMVVRSDKQAKVADATDRDAVPSVEVFRPQHQARPGTLSLPGNAQAWYEAPIRAQVSGYLRMWYKDIGAQVKAGDLLGEIDAPEVDQQLNQAKAALQVAVANEKLAIVTASRWQHLVASNAVSQQSTDVATSDAAAKHAATVAAEANVDRLVALEKFKRLVAPFNGIVTVRRTDVGALIKADEVPGPELFAVADIHAMRVYVRVPQAYASQVHVGMQAKLHLPDYPGRTFSAKVITKAHQIDEDSRTMLVELEAPNPDGVLSPGSFATVDFDLKPNLDALYVPSSALIFRQQGMQVAIVGKDDRIEMKNISIGRDDGATVEVVNGIAAEDRIIDKPADTLSNDEKVQVTVDRSKPDHGGASAKAEP